MPFLLLLWVVVSVLIAIPLCLWSPLPNWLAILLSPVIAFAVLWAFEAVVDYFERPKGAGRIPQRTTPVKNFVSEPSKRRCPSCDSSKVAPILYGLPGLSEELQRDLDAKRVVLGGCMLYDGAPEWCCMTCNHQFGAIRVPTGSQQG